MPPLSVVDKGVGASLRLMVEGGGWRAEGVCERAEGVWERTDGGAEGPERERCVRAKEKGVGKRGGNVELRGRRD